MQVKFYQGQPAHTMGLLLEWGVRWVREELHWSDLEREPGEYQPFSAAFEERLSFYRRHGIGVLFLLAYSNSVAYPDTPEQPHRSIDPEAFARYAEVITQRLRAAGVSFVLEVWNEPHSGEIQRKLGGEWQGASEPGTVAPWVAHYVKIVHAVSDAVRRIDDRIRVLAQDDMWIVHYWFLQAQLPKGLAGLSVHPYQPRPERAAVDADTSWTQPHQVVDRDGSFRSAVHRLKAQGRRFLEREPAIWISEVGWILPHPGAKYPASPSLQAAYLPRIYIGAFAAGVEVTCWYSAFDVFDEGPWGLLDKQLRPRACEQALRTMARMLAQLPMISHVAGAGTPTQGLQAIWFGTGMRDQCVVLWSADDQPRQVRLRCHRTVLVDGTEGLEAAAPAAPRVIEVGAAPVYVLGAWRQVELQQQLQGLS